MHHIFKSGIRIRISVKNNNVRIRIKSLILRYRTGIPVQSTILQIMNAYKLIMCRLMPANIQIFLHSVNRKRYQTKKIRSFLVGRSVMATPFARFLIFRGVLI